MHTSHCTLEKHHDKGQQQQHEEAKQQPGPDKKQQREVEDGSSGGAGSGGGGEEEATTSGRPSPNPEDELEFFAALRGRGQILERFTRSEVEERIHCATHRHLWGARQPWWVPPALAAGSFLTRPFRMASQAAAQRVMRVAVEEEFDAAEFVEGAKGAIVEVMTRYGAQAWDELSGMVGQQMLTEMKAAHTELLEQHGLKVAGIDTYIHAAHANLVCCWGRDSVAEFDAARADADLIAGTVPYWNLAVVQVLSDVRVRYEDSVDSGGEGGGGGGVDSSEGGVESGSSRSSGAERSQGSEGAFHESRRRGGFVFARGPLPPRSVPEVHAPWWLIGWL